MGGNGRHRTRVAFRPAEAEDVEFLASRLREADVREVRALGYRSARAALEASLASSDVAFTGLIDGVPAMVFGAGAPVFAESGMVWALGTDLLTAHPRAMLLHGREKIRELLEFFPVLENWCDARYDAAHRWLKRLGFTLSEPVPYGAHGELFVKISIRKKGV